MCASVYGKKIGFCDDLASFEVMVIAFLGPEALQDCEDCDIKALIDMSAVCRIAENNDIVNSRIFKEAASVVRDVTINEKKSIASSSFLLGLCVKVFDPFNADFAINPALLGIANTRDNKIMLLLCKNL